MTRILSKYLRLFRHTCHRRNIIIAESRSQEKFLIIYYQTYEHLEPQYATKQTKQPKLSRRPQTG